MYHFDDETGKLYLIEQGVLPKSAINWKRERNYGQLADQWSIHEKKAIEDRRQRYLKEVELQYQQESNSVAFMLMRREQRERYNELLSMTRMLTNDEFEEASKIASELAFRCGL